MIRLKSLLVTLLLAFVVQCFASSYQQVQNLPGGEGITDVSYAGYITVDEQTDSNLFYWFFEAREDPADKPIILWMTGGPGCSSALAVLFENGPFSVQDNFTLLRNPYSWNSVSNVLYIDQPYGTGFSYSNGPGVKNETEMAADMYTFLTMWFQTWSQYADNDFYISGESFGGHYVPALSRLIVESENQFNLKGVSIGNGWIHPELQYGSYGTFGYINNLISKSEYLKLNQTWLNCENLLNKGLYDVANIVCSELMSGVLQQAGNINIYNIDEPCVVPGLCYNFTTQTDYMNLKATQAALGLPRQMPWSPCQQSSISVKDTMSSFIQDLPAVLDSGRQVVGYHGMLDLICNWVGGSWTYSQMIWDSQSQFDSAPTQNWEMNGQVVGSTKNFANLTFIKVEQAGHMVPHDQPAVALQMITNLLNGAYISK